VGRGLVFANLFVNVPSIHPNKFQPNTISRSLDIVGISFS